MRAGSSPNRAASSATVPDADELAGGEDADPVADRLDLVEQVAREEDGDAALADERPEQVEDLDDADRVDRRRRLVEDEDRRVLDQRVGDAEPLEHAARVRVDARVGAVGHADLLEDLVDPSPRHRRPSMPLRRAV